MPEALAMSTEAPALSGQPVQRTVALAFAAAERSRAPRRSAEGHALRLSAYAALEAGDHDRAAAEFAEALARCEADDDHCGTAEALVGLGLLFESLDDAGGALDHYRRAARLERETGDRLGEARTLRRISRLLAANGDPGSALDAARQSLALSAEAGSAADRAKALIAAGVALRAAGRPGESAGALDEAIESLRSTDPVDEPALSRALAESGETLAALEARVRAEPRLAEARLLAERHRELAILARSSLALARTALSADDVPRVRASAVEAIDVARVCGDVELEAQGRELLAEALRAAGHPTDACMELANALVLRRQREQDVRGRRLRAAELRARLGPGSAIDEAGIRARALEHAYAELETLNISLRAADRAKTELLAELERKTFEDALTGLHNRRYVELRLAEEFQRAVRHRRPLSVAVLDVDGFRRVNRGVSHGAGDEALRAVAAAIGQSVRATDVVARYGGDEFAVIFLDADDGGALGVARKIREAIARIAPPSVRASVSLTASVGFAVHTEATSHEKLLALAEQRAVVAKRAGGDRVVARAAD